MEAPGAGGCDTSSPRCERCERSANRNESERGVGGQRLGVCVLVLVGSTRLDSRLLEDLSRYRHANDELLISFCCGVDEITDFTDRLSPIYISGIDHCRYNVGNILSP